MHSILSRTGKTLPWQVRAGWCTIRNVMPNMNLRRGLWPGPLRAGLISAIVLLSVWPFGAYGQAEKPAEPEAPAEQERKFTVDLSNPRAAMRSFLVAMQDALADQPERIDDAVSCLDISSLEGEDRLERARSLARRLHAIIDHFGVKLDDIPTEPEDRFFEFKRVEPASMDEPALLIRVDRDPDTGLWRFTASTLASVPALEESQRAQAEAPKPVETDVPAARRSARATMATFREAVDAEPPDFDAAALCFDPTGQDREAWAVQAKTHASKLKNVMDKIKLVVLTEIPDAHQGEPFVWFTGEFGNIVIGRINEIDPGLMADWHYTPKVGEWRFTPQTLKTLDALYKEYEDKPIIRELQDAGVAEQLTLAMRLDREIPDWAKREYLGLQGWQWAALVALLPVGWLLKVLGSLAAKLALRLTLRKRYYEIERDKRRRAAGAIGAIAAVFSWHIAIQYMNLPAELFGVLLRATQLTVAVTLVWAGYRFVDVVGGYIIANKDVRLTEIDEVLIPLLSKVLRIVVVGVVVLIVLRWFGYTPSTVLGALGIGGLALAFAAQDTLGNFFGSITVLFDRPFGIGDWIVVGDTEGTVERVGFRSTRVRTFYNSVITVPNSQMVKSSVDNYGARRYRRVRTMISITYATPPELIDAFCEGIRELVRLHPYTRKDYYHVYFNKFEASSLDILLYIFFEAPDWSTELRERHRLFVDILRLADRLGVEFAFPTQTVWLEKGDASARNAPFSIDSSRDDPESVGAEQASGLFEETYGSLMSRRPPVVIEGTPRGKRGRDASPDA